MIFALFGISLVSASTNTAKTNTVPRWEECTEDGDCVEVKDACCTARYGDYQVKICGPNQTWKTILSADVPTYANYEFFCVSSAAANASKIKILQYLMVLVSFGIF